MALNIETKVIGKVLTVTIDLSKDFGPSKSGKTTIVASTQGNIPVPDADGLILGVNAYKSRKLA